MLYYAEKDGFGLYIQKHHIENYEADGYTITEIEETELSADTMTDNEVINESERVSG